MATNLLGNGETITYLNADVTDAEAIASGDLVLIGSLVGVAIADIAVGDSGAVHIGGVWELPKVSAQAWTQGQILYYAAATSNITSTAGSNKIAGFAYAAAANPSSTGQVRLNPGVVN